MPTPEETFDTAASYAQLISEIPSAVASSCVELSFSSSVPPEVGEAAEALCQLPSGALATYVNYKLFNTTKAMNTFYDTQHSTIADNGTVSGPGCGQGPGDGTWAHGKKMCYLYVTSDANVMWTQDQLHVVATALRSDGDWAKLEQFWQSAGPTAP